jgi:hypothetical protein
MTLRFDALGRLVREHLTVDVTVDIDAVMAATDRRVAQGRMKAVAAVGFVILTAVCVGWVTLRFADEPVAVVDDDAPEGFFEASTSPRQLRFSDGSLLSANSGSRLRVGDRSRRGAKVTLEAGSVDFDIPHRDDTSWTVEAGPVEVKVRGTAFTVRYDPTADQVDVELTRGSVEVLRTGSPPVLLRSGQRLVVESTRKRLVIDEPQRFPERDGGRAALSPAIGTRPVATPTVPARNSASGSTSIAELLAQAESLRLARRQDEARVAYELVRQRGRGTSEGATAAFQLGRLAELSGKFSEARRWYEAALADGAVFDFGPEALGRLMALLEASGERAAARDRANEYLKMAPSGGWSAMARKLLGAGQ